MPARAKTLSCHPAAFLTSALLLLLLGPLAPTPAREPSTTPRDARRLRETAALRDQLTSLHLSRAQARQLLPLVEQAAALQTEAYQQEAARLAPMIDAFADFAAEDRLNQGFTPDVERRTARINHEDSVARDTLHQQLTGLEQDAGKLLTRSQRDGLEAAGSPASRQTMGRVARTASPRDWRTMQQGAATADRLRDLRDELQELHSRKSPRLGPLGRCLFDSAAYEPLAQTAGVKLSDTLRQAIEIQECGTPERPLFEVERQRGEVARLRTEINNWNLINGLHLSQEQIGRIREQLQAAGGPRDTAGPVFSRYPAAERARLELAVEEVLNLGQQQVIADYKACLIPPKNLKDPVRVGQASDHSQYEQWLAKNRQLNGPALDKAIAIALDREAEHFGPPRTEERKQRETTLRSVARTAAKMSTTEFELGKADLAAQAAPPDRVREITHEMDALARADGQPGRIAHFMLNPAFTMQLRERGRQLAAGIETAPTDLATGPQAENCAKGCAL